MKWTWKNSLPWTLLLMADGWASCNEIVPHQVSAGNILLLYSIIKRITQHHVPLAFAIRNSKNYHEYRTDTLWKVSIFDSAPR